VRGGKAESGCRGLLVTPVDRHGDRVCGNAKAKY
jgi:hypothetical protein